MKKNPIILLLMLTLSSCIYKYTPDVSEEYGRVVIEGDISIGTVSHFSASRVIPLGVSFAGAVSPGVSKASFKVEDEDGTEYKEKGSTGDIDLSSASADSINNNTFFIISQTNNVRRPSRPGIRKRRP